MRKRAHRGSSTKLTRERELMLAGKWDQTEAFGKPNSAPGITTPMTDPSSFAMLDGIADAREGRPAAPPEGAYWLDYLEGYARDPNLLPWEA